MHCSLCKASGHNKRTCPLAPPASEVRAANKLAALLSPPRAPKAVPKPLEGLRDFAKSFKEPKEFFTPAKTFKGPKPLEGLQDFAKSFKEPKEFFTPAKTTSKQSRVCSKCGISGHNSRTCTKVSLIENAKALVGQRRCGLCGENGHNRRSCVLAQALPLMPTSPHTVNAKTCSICGEKGHNSRTCQMKCKPCAENSPKRNTTKITFAHGLTHVIDLGIA